MSFETIDNHCKVVRAVGNIDISNIGEFDMVLGRAATESPGGFVIDLSEATYLDSAGMKAILAAYQQVTRAGGTLSTVVCTRNVRDLFDLMQLGALPGLCICEDIEVAKEHAC